MKVLMTADAVGGVWTYALELAAALAPHDVRVVLATMGPEPSELQRASAHDVSNLELKVSNYRLEWMQDPWADVDRAGEWLGELAARESVDLIHVNGYAHAALQWSRPVLVVGHSCVCSWWQAVHGVAPPAEWNSYRERVCAGLAHADRIVAPTRAFLDCLRSWYAPKARSHVIPNARSKSLFEGVDGVDRLPIALACGRMWDEAKGLQTLDAIAADLPWRIYVAGDLTAPGGKSRCAHALGCLGSMPVADLALWMRRASIFVHPSRYEPFGLAVLEAAMAGCALVLADLPSLRELWTDAAVFVDAADPDAWRHDLRALMNDDARRRALADAARTRAQRLSPQAMGRAYMDVYRQMLAGHNSRERAVA